MRNGPSDPNAKRKAQEQFTSSGQRDSQFHQDRQKAKAADMAKMAKLRALRLARDAAAPPPAPVETPKSKRGAKAP